MITLQNNHWQVGILPETGASIAFGHIKHHNTWVDVMRPNAEFVIFNCGLPKFGVLPRFDAEPSSCMPNRSVSAKRFCTLVDNTVVRGPINDPEPT